MGRWRYYTKRFSVLLTDDQRAWLEAESLSRPGRKTPADILRELIDQARTPDLVKTKKRGGHGKA
jgi:hypothetical protein